MRTRLDELLDDPFLGRLYAAVRAAGPIRSISVDLTHECNLRCTGCYFFSEGMDQSRAPSNEAALDELIAREVARGTNFVTVVGGEPSLELGRLARLQRSFRLIIATNGQIAIPRADFPELPIGVSVWGDGPTDARLRGGGRNDLFTRALGNYRDDARVFWYYTVSAGHAAQIADVVARCVDNGNRVLFNYYSDLDALGGAADHGAGFAAVRREIDQMIERYPRHVLFSRYLNQVLSSGELHGERWGYETCTSITADHPVNSLRIANGRPFNPHFRAYNADLVSTRRCCTGHTRDCSSCFDVWQRFSWIMLSMRRHLASAEELTRWLTTVYLFYLINRLVDFDDGVGMLPEIHRRLS